MLFVQSTAHWMHCLLTKPCQVSMSSEAICSAIAMPGPQDLFFGPRCCPRRRPGRRRRHPASIRSVDQRVMRAFSHVQLRCPPLVKRQVALSWRSRAPLSRVNAPWKSVRIASCLSDIHCPHPSRTMSCETRQVRGEVCLLASFLFRNVR